MRHSIPGTNISIVMPVGIDFETVEAGLKSNNVLPLMVTSCSVELRFFESCQATQFSAFVVPIIIPSFIGMDSREWLLVRWLSAAPATVELDKRVACSPRISGAHL